jgi:ferric-dicitrate binding protein FerR (iron transport regulator)
MSTSPFPDIDELLQRLLDDQLEPDEMSRLQRAILEDPRVRDYYIDSMFVSAMVRRSSQVTGELSKSDLMQAISSGANQSRSERFRHRIRSVAAILLFGILVTVCVSVFHRIAQGPAIGTLTGEYEARWRGSYPGLGEPLYAGRYDLYEGVAQMELGQGTSILLEAPCQVELKNADEVVLRKGRVSAVVPSQEMGFRVRTSTALISDMGTEFGVIAQDGRTEAHVFKGCISVTLNPNQANQATSVVVNEHFAAVVDATKRNIQSGLVARADLFLLQLPFVRQSFSRMSRISLADIVGGGNGRGTGTLDQGIDLGTGLAYSNPNTTIRRIQQSTFRLSPQFRGVDGVFVPNGALGPVVISSTGLTFSECPRTTGSFFSGPTNSGKFFDIPKQQTVAARFNGISFGSSAHPALTLHPNAGITFDLDRIRQGNSDIIIDRFTSVCGIPKDMPQVQFSSSDVWVLLDGIVCQHLNFPVERNVVEKIDIPIPTQTRFLTLVTTCSGPADYSWVLFGDPFLESAASTQEETNP